MTEYVTQQGDTWDIVSLKVYGSEKYMTRLIDANPYHRTVVIFTANVKLNVPNLPAVSNYRLPPWKRGGNR